MNPSRNMRLSAHRRGQSDRAGGEYAAQLACMQPWQALSRIASREQETGSV